MSGCSEGSYPCSGEGWPRDAWQPQLVVDGRGGDDLGRGHGGHALEGFVFHRLVLLTAVTKGSALTRMEGGRDGGVCVWGGLGGEGGGGGEAEATRVQTKH